MKEKLRQLLFITASGLFLFLSWHPNNSLTIFLSFIGFAPALYVLINEKIALWRFLFYIFLSLLLWNAFTTWWIVYSTFFGATLAIVTNSILMVFPFLITALFIKKTKNIYLALLFFIGSWMSFEYFHFNWDGSWAWLTLGNVFANSIYLVQWYEYTGVAGGSLWILFSNCLIVLLLSTNVSKKKWRILIGSFLGLIFIPIIVSFITLNSFKHYLDVNPPTDSLKCIIVQPSIDPYGEKYDNSKKKDILQKLISLSLKNIDETTDIIVWPETSIPFNLMEWDILTNPALHSMRLFLDSISNGKLLAGEMTYQIVDTITAENRASVRKYSDELYYQIFNTAILFEKGKPLQIRHKSKLTPGVEIMPLSKIFSFINNLTFDLGGITGSLGYDQESIVFYVTKNGKKIFIAPLICYENNYGDFVSTFIRQKASILFLISNDGWWGDTQGYKQHSFLSQLRCIENRRWLVQSSNTGISCFVTPFGNAIDSKGWYETTSFSRHIPAITYLSFYSQHGDWLYSLFLVLWLSIIGFYIFVSVKPLFKKTI